MEALAIMLLVLGVASAIFVLLHTAYTLPMVPMPVKIAWCLTALVLPVLGACAVPERLPSASLPG